MNTPVEHNRYPVREYRKSIRPHGEAIIFQVVCCGQSKHHAHRVLSIYDPYTNRFELIPNEPWICDNDTYDKLLATFDNEAEIMSEGEVDLIMAYAG